jgi:hypothetical protein
MSAENETQNFKISKTQQKKYKIQNAAETLEQILNNKDFVKSLKKSFPTSVNNLKYAKSCISALDKKFKKKELHPPTQQKKIPVGGLTFSKKISNECARILNLNCENEYNWIEIRRAILKYMNEHGLILKEGKQKMYNVDEDLKKILSLNPEQEEKNQFDSFYNLIGSKIFV